MKKNRYSPEETQIILDNYDHSVSMFKNAEAIAPMLNNRNARALHFKFSNMKRDGKLEAVIKEVVAQESKFEKDMHAELVKLFMHTLLAPLSIQDRRVVFSDIVNRMTVIDHD